MLQTSEKAAEKWFRPGGHYFMGIQVRVVAASIRDHGLGLEDGSYLANRFRFWFMRWLKGA
jgi:hypothetical protein